MSTPSTQMLVLGHMHTCILDLQRGVAVGCYVGDDAQEEGGVLPNTLVKGKLKYTRMEPGKEPQWRGTQACT